MDWNRISSGLVAAIFIVAAFAENGAKAGGLAFAFVILPLACVWFADTVGDYIEQSGSGFIGETKPAWILRILGWLLLLWPVVLGLIFLR